MLRTVTLPATWFASLAISLTIPALAQPIAFDVASVKVVKLDANPVIGNRGGPGTKDPTRVHLCCVGMFYLLMTAYDVELDQIFGPAWIMENYGPNLYEIDAVMRPGTTMPQYHVMLQQLLQERFHLALHREKRNFPGYELLVDSAGGPLLKEHAVDPGVDPPPFLPLPKRDSKGLFILGPGPRMYTALGWGVITVQVQQKPLSELVKVMGRMINQSLGENPNDYLSPKARVLDKTGLTGTYDFTLRFSCELCQFAAINGDPPPPPPAAADTPTGQPSIFNALRKQLGLRLNKVKDLPLEVIVVDHIEKTPTPN